MCSEIKVTSSSKEKPIQPYKTEGLRSVLLNPQILLLVFNDSYGQGDFSAMALCKSVIALSSWTKLNLKKQKIFNIGHVLTLHY